VQAGGFGRTAWDDRANAGLADELEPGIGQRGIVDERCQARGQDGDRYHNEGLQRQSCASL